MYFRVFSLCFVLGKIYDNQERQMKKLLIIVLLLGIAAVYQVRKTVIESGPLTEVVNVIIPKGASSALAAQKLAEADVINEPLLFRIIARLNGSDKKLRAGEYQFAPQISMLKVMEKIASGDVYYRRLTIPEGKSAHEIIELIKAVPELTGEVDMVVREGELLPETYSYEYGDSRNSVIMQAKNAMKKVVDEVWIGRDENLPLKDINQLLTLASIIEKETGVPEERGLVASVFVNRLKKGMKLQTDPTVIYAITSGREDLGRSLKRNDLNLDSPYNTYKYYGLPPAPICSPGREAIQAAAHPQASEFLYFVATGNGGHNFSKNLSEHNRNVKAWVKTLKK